MFIMGSPVWTFIIVMGIELLTGLKRRSMTPLLEEGYQKLIRILPYLELGQVLMCKHIYHLVGLQRPNPVGGLLRMLGHNFSVKFIKFNKVGILKYKI